MAKENGCTVQVGPRPYYLVDDMREGELKEELRACAAGPFERSAWNIADRGAPLQFPELTRIGYEGAIRMGAGMIEWDVVFTKDRELINRHGFCNLHATTDVLARPKLAAKCTEPFTPAKFNEDGELVKPASAKCCSTDFTLEEIKQLSAVMEGENERATRPEDFHKGTASWRTDLYTTYKEEVLTNAEMVELAQKLGVKMNPDFKNPEPDVAMPFQGDYTHDDYAQDLADEFYEAGVDMEDVLPIAFTLDYLLYWIENEPCFGRDAGWLDSRYGLDPDDPDTWDPTMEELFDMGVRTLSPPMRLLLSVDENGEIVPSEYAKMAKKVGLNLTTWTFERSGRIGLNGGFYYSTVKEAIETEGDVYEVLDVLAQDVGVMGIANDWAGTVAYYATCKDVKSY